MTLRARLLSLVAILGLGLGAAHAGASHASTTLQPITTAATAPGDTLAVIYSGDGGWGKLDKAVAQQLADKGVPVIGVNSLAYFMTARTPKAAANDLADQARRYQALWGRKKIVLIGYSFGADALPVIVPALPADVRAQVRSVVLVGVGQTGALKFRPNSWLNRPGPESYPVAPAVAALKGLPMTCIYGDKERHDACLDLSMRRVELHGGHHFDGDYARLGQAVIDAAAL